MLIAEGVQLVSTAHPLHGNVGLGRRRAARLSFDDLCHSLKFRLYCQALTSIGSSCAGSVAPTPYIAVMRCGNNSLS